MENSKKRPMRMAAVVLIICIMQWHTAYAAVSSRSEPLDITTVSDEGDAEKGTSGTEDSTEGGSDQNTNEESGNISDQNSDVQQEEETDQDLGIQQEEELKQDVDQQEEKTDQDVEKISDGSQSDDGQTDQNQGEGNNEQMDQNQEEEDNGQMDQNQEEVEDDDEWADGDDEWTDAWTGADDEMEGNEWADDIGRDRNKDKSKESELATASVDSKESHGEGEVYIAKNEGLSVSSKSSRAVLDQNYQTGAGLGNDIFLILAVACGITAIGLSARKRNHKS